MCGILVTAYSLKEKVAEALEQKTKKPNKPSLVLEVEPPPQSLRTDWQS